MSRSHQCQGEVATRNTGTHPLGYGPAPSGYVPPQLEACLLSSLEAGSDALQPGAGTGLEYCAWGESQRSQTHISQQPGQGCLPESVWDQGRIKAWGSENGLHSPSVCMPVSATQAEGTPFQCKRPGDPGQGLLFAHPVAKNFHQPHWGNGPLAPRNGRKQRWTQGQIGRLSWGHSVSWWVNWQVEGVFGAWQMQGLIIAGAYLGADPGTSAGNAGGNDGAGLGLSLPILPRYPRVSRASDRALLGGCGPHSASLGTSEASARQMGHVRLAFNHLSTHLVWNSWLQGRTRSSCRASKSLKQTTHSVCSD